MPLVATVHKFMGEKEVTERYLPFTQRMIQNAGGRKQEGNKEQNYKMKRMQTYQVLHPAPGKKSGRQLPWRKEVCGTGGSKWRPGPHEAGKDEGGRYRCGWETGSTKHRAHHIEVFGSDGMS